MSHIRYIVGIDEVGRGPVAGPVTVCALAVAADFDVSRFKGIRDSKKLSPKKREEWFQKITEWQTSGDLNFAITSIPADEIDRTGIAPAIKRALAESLDKLGQLTKLNPKETKVLLDGSLKAPEQFTIQETIIKGDEKIPVISAASIVAKVNRDRYMTEQASLYPEYGFEKHKGYGTKSHMTAIKKHGMSILHRRSFL